MKTQLGFIFLWVGSFMFSSLFAQEAKTLDLAESVENSLLWEISGNGLEKSSYLFGTMHLIPQDSFFVPKAYHEAVENSDRLLLEIELDGQAMMETAMGMMLKPPASLKKLLGDEDYTFLQSFMKDSLKMPIPMYQMYKPIFLAQQVAVNYCMSEMPASYELNLMNKFNDLGKPISGLETVGEQLAVMDEISLEEQATSLMEAIRDPKKSCQQFQELIQTYRQQNLNALLALSEKDPEIEEHLGSLLYERNQKWIPKIEEFIGKESVFIAVGAGHLPGEKGVISLLREKGYSVKGL